MHSIVRYFTAIFVCNFINTLLPGLGIVRFVFSCSSISSQLSFEFNISFKMNVIKEEHTGCGFVCRLNLWPCACWNEVVNDCVLLSRNWGYNLVCSVSYATGALFTR